MTRTTMTLAALLLLGCSAQVDTTPPDAPTCAIIGYEPRARDAASSVWQFSDVSAPNPDAALCEPLGDGVFSCRPEACLTVPVPGTCPACSYVGTN